MTLFEKIKYQSGCLDQRANAFGAQCLFYLTTILDDRHPLQVGMEGTIGDAMRERDVMTEGSGFATVSAFRHF